MPELPEVETVRRGLEPLLLNQIFSSAQIIEPRLKIPISSDLPEKLARTKITEIKRRGKYLLLKCDKNQQIIHLLIHLGMTGSLRVLPQHTPLQPHVCIDFLLENGQLLRYTDPRRFGLIEWIEGDPLQSKHLAHFGPEPFEEAFNTEYFYQQLKRRRVPIKNLIMENQIVVGVGNIYASESLFHAGILPTRLGASISFKEAEKLREEIISTLNKALEQGGTTIRNFTNAEGNAGYFKQFLYVYGRNDQPCHHCKTLIQQITQGQRSTYFCPNCQK
jgi:formamidopyrimidine-DNA glycosylase